MRSRKSLLSLYPCISSPLRAVSGFLVAVLVLSPALIAEEPVDWEVITRIREEGLHHSRAMETLRHLTEEIGPRLTGSPRMKQASEWVRDRMTEWGFDNAHLEPFEFGRGWSFSRTAVHLVEPIQMPLIALPEAWTPGTDGPVRGELMQVDIESEEDFEEYRGKLRGKVLLMDDARELRESSNGPVTQRYDEEDLEERMQFEMPGDGPDEARRRRFRKRWQLRQKLNEFLSEEGVVAVLEISSRDSGLVRVGGGGSRWPDEDPGPPSLVVAAEHYNKLVRLVEARKPEKEEEEEKKKRPGDDDAGEDDAGEDGEADDDRDPHAGAHGTSHETVEGGPNDQAEKEPEGEGEEPEEPVVVEIDVRARFHDEDPHAYNTVAELPGGDLGHEVVLAGGHLDSWHGGTGATDNGASCVVVMEALRILEAVGVQPRRTLRMVLWAGEEQGLLGSRAYVAKHYASRPEPEDPKQKRLPFFLRDDPGPLTVKPDHAKVSAYFNLDNGGGKIRGIYAQENAGVVPIFEAWLRPFHDLGATTVTQNNTRGTDHLSFHAVGLPGFQFIQDPLDYFSRTHHTNMDTLEHVHEDDLKQAAVVLASFLYHAAMRDDLLPRHPMPRDD